MDSEDSDNGLFGCLSPVWTQLSFNPSPSSSSTNSNINQTSGSSLDLSPLVHGSPSSSSMDSDIIMQSSPPSSDVSLLGQGGPTSTPMDSNIKQTIGPSSYLSLLGREGTTSSSSNSTRSFRYDVATIADCHQQFKQTVFPVFYHMEPSHVRKQNGVYENAFILHNKKFKQDPGKVDRWKTAMMNLGYSNGWHVDDKPEFGEIDKIVQVVIKALGHKFSGIADDLIGIQPHIEKLEKLLKLSSENDDFRVLGIWGMGGIGKTTHATVLYDRISYQFAACCFIENVSKIYRDGGAIAVQKQILRKTLGEINLEAYGPLEISGVVRHRLHNLKVLIVLDNVDQLEQLQELAIDPKLLHTGSRIIIITRDEHVLKVYGVQAMYDVPLLNSNDARELLCKKAFKSEGQSSNCVENPALWSRLWRYKDLYDAFMIEAGRNDAEAIVLHQEEDVSMCMADAEGLSKMRNLKLLILCQNRFFGSLSFLSNQLRYLFWQGYPFASLPPNFQPYNLLELNMPASNMQQLWEGCKNFRSLERVDLSNSKCLTTTPNFERSKDMKRLDLTGCTNLSNLHPSIGSLTKLTYMSLRNCSNLVRIDFPGGLSSLSSLRVLHLSGCTKLESTRDFTGASNLEYLDMDGCTSLSLVHESIGALSKLRFLSMRSCTNLVNIPSNIITMSSLVTLDFYGCSKLRNFLPLESAGTSSSNMKSRIRKELAFRFGSTSSKSLTSMKSLISADLSFCNLRQLPDAVGELSCLERLNLQGNKFISLHDTIDKLSCLAYLNLSHCHELESLIPTPRGSASSVGRYFTTTSGARDHRSGFYAFDCPKVRGPHLWNGDPNRTTLERMWLDKLVKKPRNFRCGFNVVIPWEWSDANSLENGIIPDYFTHKFKGDSIKRTKYCNVNDKWDGFVFGVAFEVNNNHLHAISTSPHPFYLSFESEYTEKRFDMPLNLELNKIVGSRYLWIIYISREHCHFVRTGADITFKARPGLMVKEWGLSRVLKQVIMPPENINQSPHADHLVIENVEKSTSNSELKIQLSYNWLVTEEDEVENFEAKAKENRLSNLGLHTGQPISQLLDTDELLDLDTDELLDLDTGGWSGDEEEEVKIF